MTKIQVNSQGKAYFTDSNKVLLGKDLGTKSITANGTYAASSDSLDGYSSVTVNVSGGSSPVITSLTVTPSTSLQVITTPIGTDGYNPITVPAVNSSIDANITAGNIKDGVTILGVTGSYTGSGGGNTKFGMSIDDFIGDVTSGVLSAPNQISNGIVFTGVTEIYDAALKYSFCEKSVSGGIAFPVLTTVGNSGLYNAFRGNAITGLGVSSITTINSYGFYEAFMYNQITSVNLHDLTTVGDDGLYYAFSNNAITAIDLISLTTIGNEGLYSAFGYNEITSARFDNLTYIDKHGLAYAFEHQQDTNKQTTLTDLYFPALTSQSFADEYVFNNMLNDNDGVTVHFPSDLQATLSNWSDVINGFGGTNTTVLYDITNI